MKRSFHHLLIFAIISAGTIAAQGVVARPAHRETTSTSQKFKSDSVYNATTHIDDVAAELGLTTIEHAHIDKGEDTRLIDNIRNAHNIKILVSNGSNLINNFKTEFTDFLAKPGSSMQVLLATADSDFYREETELTIGFKPGEQRYKDNLALVALGRSRLESYAGAEHQNQLQIRYFDTQFRFPMIIVDNRYCYLTIRLSPNEASQSMRMEFDQKAASMQPDYATSCVTHFDRLWGLSSPNGESNRWLASLGLSSWTRTELMALVACIGTLLAGIGALLAIPPIQRLLRLEKQLGRVDIERGKIDNPNSTPSSPTEHHRKKPRRH